MGSFAQIDERLKWRRDRLGWSQEDLARATDGQVSAETIDLIEQAVIARPRKATLNALETALRKGEDAAGINPDSGATIFKAGVMYKVP